MADQTAYWLRGFALYRSKLGAGSKSERWDGQSWQHNPDLLRMMLNGEPSLDEVTEKKARSRFPAAFQVSDPSR